MIGRRLGKDGSTGLEAGGGGGILKITFGTALSLGVCGRDGSTGLEAGIGGATLEVTFEPTLSLGACSHFGAGGSTDLWGTAASFFRMLSRSFAELERPFSRALTSSELGSNFNKLKLQREIPMSLVNA